MTWGEKGWSSLAFLGVLQDLAIPVQLRWPLAQTQRLVERLADCNKRRSESPLNKVDSISRTEAGVQSHEAVLKLLAHAAVRSALTPSRMRRKFSLRDRHE